MWYRSDKLVLLRFNSGTAHIPWKPTLPGLSGAPSTEYLETKTSMVEWAPWQAQLYTLYNLYLYYTYTPYIPRWPPPPPPKMWFKSNKLVLLRFKCSKTLYSINVELYLLKPKFQTKYYLLRIKCFKTCNLREGGRKKWYFNMHN